MKNRTKKRHLLTLSAGLLFALALQTTPVKADEAEVPQTNVQSDAGKEEENATQNVSLGWTVRDDQTKAYQTEDGLLTGVQEIDGVLYLFDDNGTLHQDNAWVQYQGNYYFPNAEGVLYRDRMITFGPYRAYYMDHDGTLGTGFREIGETLSFFDYKTGKRHQDNDWVNTERGWVFPNAEGKVYRDRLITFGPQVAYYMDHDGTIGTGFREVGKDLMYFNANGMRDQRNGWMSTERGQVFVNAEGKIYRNQFITFGNKLAYYMGNDGVAVTGAVSVNGTVYRMTGANGARLVREGEYAAEGKTFYADANGVPVRNQIVTVNGVQYYHGKDGARLFKNFTLGDYDYTVDPSTGAIQGRESNVPKAVGKGAPKLYSLRDLNFQGIIWWNGYKFTYYSQSVLPGGGLRIPGRHVNEDGYVADGDGYIVLANDAPKGTVIPTPFGYYGKVYDRGTVGNHFDVYTK